MSRRRILHSTRVLVDTGRERGDGVVRVATHVYERPQRAQPRKKAPTSVFTHNARLKRAAEWRRIREQQAEEQARRLAA